MKPVFSYISIVLTLFLTNLCSFANENLEILPLPEIKNEKTAYLSETNIIPKKTAEKEEDKIKQALGELELEVLKLNKGRKFLVISSQNLSDSDKYGIPVSFESVHKEYILSDNKPSKVVFKGIIEKTQGPRFAGKSGSVKIKLEKITIDSITYPVSAIISKINDKSVFFNTLNSAPCYLSNLALTANQGVMNNSIKDPCTNEICTVNTLARPLIFLGAAGVGLADLLISPIAALKLKGDNTNIPKNTYFEIKLDEELHILDI